jgi:hypothetical protein
MTKIINAPYPIPDPPVSSKFNQGGGGGGPEFKLKPMQIERPGFEHNEINDPGSIPDPPGRSTFNEGGGGVRNFFPPKNHFPIVCHFCPFYLVIFQTDF